MVESTAFLVAFYIALGLLAMAGAYAWNAREMGVGIPMGAVLNRILSATLRGQPGPYAPETKIGDHSQKDIERKTRSL